MPAEAIGAAHRDAGAPTATEGVKRVLKGLGRQAAGRGRGQEQGLNTDDVGEMLAAAPIPRRTGRGMESEAGQPSGAPSTGPSVNGCARAIRQLRDRRTVQRSGLRPDAGELVLGGLNGQSIARRLTAAARAAGIDGRITGHSGRIGLAQELTRRGAPEQAVARAGGWKSSRMVTHYSAAVLAEQGAVATYLRCASNRFTSAIMAALEASRPRIRSTGSASGLTKQQARDREPRDRRTR